MSIKDMDNMKVSYKSDDSAWVEYEKYEKLQKENHRLDSLWHKELKNVLRLQSDITEMHSELAAQDDEIQSLQRFRGDALDKKHQEIAQQAEQIEQAKADNRLLSVGKEVEKTKAENIYEDWCELVDKHKQQAEQIRKLAYAKTQLLQMNTNQTELLAQQAEQIAELHRQGNALLLEAAKDRQEIQRLKEAIVHEQHLKALARHAQVKAQDEVKRLKELLGKVHETVGGTIEVLNTDDAITDTLWYDEYCTVVDTLGSMQDCIKGVLREAAQPQKGDYD